MQIRAVLLATAFLVNLGATNKFPAPTDVSQSELAALIQRFQSEASATQDSSQDTTTSDDPTVSPVTTSDSKTDASSQALDEPHYSIDDLASSIHSLGPDRRDSSHHTISDLADQMGGL
jgi:hypothetical protein